MIFGNKKTFAIQAMIEPDLIAPSSIWGRMNIVVYEVEYGDFNEQYCGIYQCQDHLKSIRDSIEDYWDDSFNGISDQKLAEQFFYSWFEDGCHENGKENEFGKLLRYRLDYGLAEMFDREKEMSFILSPPGKNIKLLFLESLEASVRACEIEKEQFCSAVDEFSSWFSEMACKFK